MLSLEVVGPGDGLSTAPSLAVTATAAYSCDRTVAARPLQLGGGWRWRRRGVPALTTMGSRFSLFICTIFRIIRLVSFNIRPFLNSPIFGLFSFSNSAFIRVFLHSANIYSYHIRPEKSAYFLNCVSFLCVSALVFHRWSF